MLSVLVLFLYASRALAQQVIRAGDVPVVAQDWDFTSAHRCRVLAHKSVVLKNDRQHILVVNGGFGSFQTEFQGEEVQVLDLNPFTAAFDLSKGFATPGLEPLWVFKKPSNSPAKYSVTNHGGLWFTPDQNTLFYQGGHFYHGANWSTSQYYVEKVDIPAWQLWRMDTSNPASGWTDITNSTPGHESPSRTFAGAAVTVPNAGKCYWVGGLIDDTTAAETQNSTLQTSSQMLEYDTTTGKIARKQYYSDNPTDGYWQGQLVHLPIGTGNGYVMSLMSLRNPLQAPWTDPDGESGNFELGKPVSLESIPLYDVDRGVWIEQPTTWFKNEIPAPRTRFCSALFHDESDNTWNLWVHGGQLLSNQNIGVQEIYVLSMPSFTWSKVETTLPDTNLIRSHTCHAVGGQLVIVGGYPPGVVEPTNVTCDAEYIKVLNIGKDYIRWEGAYKPDTQYSTPQSIRNVVNGRQVPNDGFANDDLRAAFAYVAPAPTTSTTPSSSASSKKTPVGAIAGGVAGGVVVLVAAAVAAFFWRRSRSGERNGNTHKSAAFKHFEGLEVASQVTKGKAQPSMTVTPVAPEPERPLSAHEIREATNRPQAG